MKNRFPHLPGTDNKTQIRTGRKVTESGGGPVLRPGQSAAAAGFVRVPVSSLETHGSAHTGDRIDKKTDAAHKKG